MALLKKFSKLQMTAIAVLLAGVGGLLAGRFSAASKPSAVAAGDAAAITKNVVAGPGLVEPESENVQVGSELAGKLKEVLADEGDHVKKGQVLAVLVNDDYQAQVEASRGQVAQAEAAYQKVLNGARPHFLCEPWVPQVPILGPGKPTP